MKQEEREEEGEARYSRDSMIQSMHYLHNIAAANYPLSLAMHRQQEMERQVAGGREDLRHNGLG